MKRYGRPHHPCSILLASVCLLVVAGDRAVVQGEELPTPTYRRVFVPADRPEEWPTHGERYLPMDREAFEQLIKAANQRRLLSEAGFVQIAVASHDIQLADDFSLRGASVFQVTLLEQSPRILRLGPWSPAISAAKWSDSASKPHEALIGMWPEGDGSGLSFGVLVERSGELVIDWTLPPPNADGSDLEYLLSLPPALNQQVTIELPAEYVPSISSGVAIAEAPIKEGAAIRWTFQVSAASEHRLQLRRPVSVASSPATQPRVSVNESYTISNGGVGYEAEFRVQKAGKASGELRLIVPEALKLNEVIVNQVQTDWQLIEGRAGRIAVPLPETASPVNVTVHAVANIVFSDSWKVPRIEAENVFWTEGTTSLWVDSSISLAKINPASAALVNTVGVGRDEGGEAYRLQCWSSDASVAVTLKEKTPGLHVETNLAAEFADSELAGRCQAKLWSSGPALHIQAALAPGWELASVEAAPPESLASWHVSGGGKDRRLHILLRRAATEQNPITLALTARKRLRTPTAAAKLEELAWIRFLGAETSSGKLLVTDHRGRELEVSSPSAGAKPLYSLSPAEREFFGEPTTGVLLAIDETPADITIRVQPSRPQVHAEAWTELVHRDARFHHQTEILCKPVKGAVSELVIAAARPIPSDAQWSLVGADDQPSVQALGRPDNANSRQGPYEYRIRLASPRSKPFRLRVAWRGAESGADSINSLTLPSASDWQSWAILRGDPASLKVDARGCSPATAIPDAEVYGESDLPILACLRLSDDPATPLAVGPQLTLRRVASQDELPGVICRSLGIVTLQLSDGSQTHRLSYDLHGYHDHTAEIELPSNVTLVSARLDGMSLSAVSSKAESIRIRIPMSGAIDSSMLVLDLRGQREPLDANTSIAAPIPTSSFPILRGQWTVAAPPPYSVEVASQRSLTAGWRQRLFGPLLDAPRASSSHGDSRAIASATSGAVSLPPGQIHVPSGWASTTTDFVTAPAPVQLRRIDSSRATRHMTWLLSAVVTAIIWPARRSIFATVWAILAIACLTLPGAWILLPQAMLLGSLSGAVAREVLSRTSIVVSGKVATGIAAVSGLSMAMAFASGAANAAEPPAAPPAVLYPIDENGTPSGKDLYAPASLLSDLLPAAADARHGGANYALVEAEYEIWIEEDSAAGGVICRKCQLRFWLRTFQDGVVVALPLNRQDGEWDVSASATDGRSIPLQWNESGKGAAIKVLKAGNHEIVVGVVPPTRKVADQGALKLNVPPLPGAQVAISHPAGIGRLMVNAVQLNPKPDTTLTEVQKSSGRVLEISWPRRLGKSLAGVTVNQLSWLHVEPAAARLDVNLRLAGDISRLQTLQLQCPPHLKLLPLAADVPVVDVQTRGGPPSSIELKLRAGSVSPVTIPLQFQLQRSMSVGNMQFPMIRVVGAEQSTHHIAITVDPELELRSQPPVGLAAISVAEFEQAWGAFVAPPSARYAVLAGSNPSWVVEIEPTPVQFTPRETLELRCGAQEVTATYAAEIDDLRGSVLTHQLIVPAEVEVGDVSLTVEGEAAGVPLRWARSAPGELSILLSRPLDQRHTLRIVGTLNYDANRSIVLPRIALEEFPSGPLNVEVYRTSEVLIQGATPPAAATSGNLLDEATQFYVGQYVVDRGAAPSVRLAVTPNNARFSADAVMTIDRSSAQPATEIIVRGIVNEGVVDSIKLAAAPELQRPVVVDANVRATVSSNGGGELGQVIELKLDEPVPSGKEFTVRLLGIISVENDQRLRFPQLRILNATQHRLFLALPEPPKNQSAEWTRRGLKRQELPESLKSAIGRPISGITYRVQDDDYLAMQRVFPDSLRRAVVRLADTSVWLDDSGEWTAECRLIVQPGGGANIALRSPPGAQVIQAVVDGQPVLAAADPEGQLLLPAGSRYLPRLVTVVYRHAPDAKQSRFEFAPPTVLIEGQSVRIARSFFRIEGMHARELAPVGADALLGPTEFENAVRRVQLAAIREASPLAFQLPEWELKHWFQPWVRMLEAPRQGKAGSDSENAWSQLRDQVAALVSDAPMDGSQEHETAPSSFAAYYQGASNGRLELVRAGRGFGTGRWMLALIVGAITVQAWRQPESLAPALRILLRWPAAVGVVAGVFWWTYLTPALFGLAIIALSVAAAIKTRQQRRLSQREPHVALVIDGGAGAERPIT